MDATRWFPAYVALGSNLDDPPAQVERAFTALAGLRGSHLVARSSLYRSLPFGPVAQPDFINAVAGMLTTLDAAAMLAELKALEDRLGRERPVVRWGPRRIDLDLLVHGTTRIDEPQIKVPHPGIAVRAFVLASERVVKYPAARSADSSRISPIPSSCGAFGSRGRSPLQY